MMWCQGVLLETQESSTCDLTRHDLVYPRSPVFPLHTEIRIKRGSYFSITFDASVLCSYIFRTQRVRQTYRNSEEFLGRRCIGSWSPTNLCDKSNVLLRPCICCSRTERPIKPIVPEKRNCN